MEKRVLFLCGSPRGRKSASRRTAEYMSLFLDYDYEFLDLAASRITSDPGASDPPFQYVAEKMEQAAAVIWTCGAWGVFVPHHFQYLFEKFFAGKTYDFSGRIAATVMTSVHVLDDYILEKMRVLSEQLGFGYIGDVSAEGNPFFGYVSDEERTESSCRMLADRINRALAENYIPPRSGEILDRRFLSADYSGESAEFHDLLTGKLTEEDSISDIRDPGKNKRTVLVVCGPDFAKHESYELTIAALMRGTKSRVDLINLEAEGLRACNGCFLCAFNGNGKCVQKDRYASIKTRMHSSDAIVLIAGCSVTGIDRHMKCFLDRNWQIAHCPSLTGKHGFTVALGGGPLGKDASWNLSQSLMKWGVTNIGALYPQGCPNIRDFLQQVERTAGELDRAMENKWEINPRFTTIGISAIFRDLALHNGMMMRSDYKYHKKNGFFKIPRRGLEPAFLRLLFRSDFLERKLLKSRYRSLNGRRNRRLQKLLASGIRRGRGSDISPMRKP